MFLNQWPVLNDAIDLTAYEPYDLNEVRQIVHQAEKAAGKVKTLDIKMRHLTLALEKVDLIIYNSVRAYQDLELNKNIDEPESFQGCLEQAQAIRKSLEIKIKELQLLQEEEKTEPNSHKNKTDENPPPKPPILETKPIMNVKELASYTGLSESTINHKALTGEIPSAKMGSRRIFVKKDIDELLERLSKKDK